MGMDGWMDGWTDGRTDGRMDGGWRLTPGSDGMADGALAEPGLRARAAEHVSLPLVCLHCYPPPLCAASASPDVTGSRRRLRTSLGLLWFALIVDTGLLVSNGVGGIVELRHGARCCRHALPPARATPTLASGPR